MKVAAGITFFFTAKDPLSNWHVAPFEYRGHRFNCVEQFMMFSKAKLFGDNEAAAKILAAQDQKTQKALGREVRGFDEAVWAAKRVNIVSVGCREKFRQNPQLLQALLATGDTILAEASPYDRIWGIGLGADDPRAADPKEWRGTNLLGQVLMDVRRMLAPYSTVTRSARP